MSKSLYCGSAVLTKQVEDQMLILHTIWAGYATSDDEARGIAVKEALDREERDGHSLVSVMVSVLPRNGPNDD